MPFIFHKKAKKKGLFNLTIKTGGERDRNSDNEHYKSTSFLPKIWELLILNVDIPQYFAEPV